MHTAFSIKKIPDFSMTLIKLVDFQGFPGFPGSVRTLCRKITENSKKIFLKKTKQKKNKKKKNRKNSKKQEKNRKTGKSLKSRKKQENRPCSIRAFIFRLQSA